MQTRLSPSVGWAVWRKQMQMPPTDHNEMLIKRKERCVHSPSKIRRPLSPDQLHLRENLWASSPRFRGLFEPVGESAGFLLCASQLGDYKSLRFLPEDITLNAYKRACHWPKEKGEETLVQLNDQPSFLASVSHTVSHWILMALLWYCHPRSWDSASQWPYNLFDII